MSASPGVSAAHVKFILCQMADAPPAHQHAFISLWKSPTHNCFSACAESWSAGVSQSSKGRRRAQIFASLALTSSVGVWDLWAC